ncbi:NAD(P)-dependent dehydrogenase (short-subunit alcohol dehydrogenase family) [Kineococcus radiotolerans]|uniref:NAD(P)-dependent dehydrogenase (Short-subunit alcohol dehydrogenase family) n=1 Tax=Kineococcus radiotolerans TaxID=131568 RepID=A0A7W4TR63_KINRA|nr:SDR family oxidoreductase [Kineococcus radiotolerans]MBB2903591.1 NAD(P)-dependent dehydrogenase (short-subunit alcohol dehydrogenase family) [Kineococcus radiotolerans]
MTARTWFITGSTSGFGRLMTEQLLQKGERVAATARDTSSLQDLAAHYGEQLWTATLDVTDTPAIRTVIEKAFTELGRIDVIVNNAGYGLFGAAEELTDEQIEHQIGTNLLGPIQILRAAVPHLRTQGGGRIIQLSTYGGQATNPGASLYHASKWGVEGFMEANAKDLAPFGIGVTIVEPGSAATGFRTGGSRLPQPLAAYDGTPAAMSRGIQNPALPSVSDPAKVAAAIIATVEQTPAPLRLVTGSDSQRYIRDALRERLADIEAQEASAAATDLSASSPTGA